MDNLSEFRTQIRSTIHDNVTASDNQVTDDEVDQFITEAVNEYSKLFPRKMVKDITSAASQYDYDLPDDWDVNFSYIYSLEFPQGKQNAVFYEKDDYTVYNDEKLRFLKNTPGSAETIRLVYFIPHSVGESASSIPSINEHSVSNYAAALCLEKLANKFAKTDNPSANMQFIDYQNKSDIYAKRARELKKLALDSWGSGDKKSQSGWASWDWI